MIRLPFFEWMTRVGFGFLMIVLYLYTGAHHHGHLESIIYIVAGRARMRWGEALEFTAEAGPGEFIYVPPYCPHQEINALEDQKLECVLVRSDGEAVAVNLPDLEPAERPEGVRWIDPTHRNLPEHHHHHHQHEEGHEHVH